MTSPVPGLIDALFAATIGVEPGTRIPPGTPFLECDPEDDSVGWFPHGSPVLLVEGDLQPPAGAVHHRVLGPIPVPHHPKPEQSPFVVAIRANRRRVPTLEDEDELEDWLATRMARALSHRPRIVRLHEEYVWPWLVLSPDRRGVRRFNTWDEAIAFATTEGQDR